MNEWKVERERKEIEEMIKSDRIEVLKLEEVTRRQGEMATVMEEINMKAKRKGLQLKETETDKKKRGREERQRLRREGRI